MDFSSHLLRVEEKKAPNGTLLRLEIYSYAELKEEKAEMNSFGFGRDKSKHYCRVYEGFNGSWNEKYFIPEEGANIPDIALVIRNGYTGPGLHFAHLDEAGVAKAVWAYLEIK